MTTIKLLDARRGLNLKCRELFKDEKIAEAIYRYLCDGIEECEDAKPEQKVGKWIRWIETKEDEYGTEYNPHCKCSECGMEYEPFFTGFVKYCYVCGAKMEGEQDGGQKSFSRN